MKPFALGLCLALMFLVHPPAPALAMPCDNRGAKERLHYGSNVKGDRVTICAEYWWPKSTAKPTVPIKPAPVKPPKIDPNWFVVSPRKPVAVSDSPRTLAIGEEFDVGVLAGIHQLKKVLLGRLTVVRFTPLQIKWRFGDHRGAVGKVARHSFAAPGTYLIEATVRYAVKFRFISSTTWIPEPRGITLTTKALRFVVSGTKPKPLVGKPFLVLFDCEGTGRPGC